MKTHFINKSMNRYEGQGNKFAEEGNKFAGVHVKTNSINKSMIGFGGQGNKFAGGWFGPVKFIAGNRQ